MKNTGRRRVSPVAAQSAKFTGGWARYFDWCDCSSSAKEKFVRFNILSGKWNRS
jgi:hypothetical protein